MKETRIAIFSIFGQWKFWCKTKSGEGKSPTASTKRKSFLYRDGCKNLWRSFSIIMVKFQNFGDFQNNCWTRFLMYWTLSRTEQSNWSFDKKLVTEALMDTIQQVILTVTEYENHRKTHPIATFRTLLRQGDQVKKPAF